MVRAFKVIYKVTLEYELRVPFLPILYAAIYIGFIQLLPYLVAPLIVA